jgi:hypothetical protein
MPGKLPIDRVRAARKAPKIFVEDSERLARHEAELRDADDPVSGARPQASDAIADSPDEAAGTDATKHE